MTPKYLQDHGDINVVGCMSDELTNTNMPIRCCNSIHWY